MLFFLFFYTFLDLFFNFIPWNLFHLIFVSNLVLIHLIAIFLIYFISQFSLSLFYFILFLYKIWSSSFWLLFILFFNLELLGIWLRKYFVFTFYMMILVSWPTSLVSNINPFTFYMMILVSCFFFNGFFNWIFFLVLSFII